MSLLNREESSESSPEIHLMFLSRSDVYKSDVTSFLSSEVETQHLHSSLWGFQNAFDYKLVKAIHYFTIKYIYIYTRYFFALCFRSVLIFICATVQWEVIEFKITNINNLKVTKDLLPHNGTFLLKIIGWIPQGRKCFFSFFTIRATCI